ncbi:MAG: hypothetical protein FWF03_08715 [Defluviitaleaceae bacterium]|nr:hypothetical protein [Defluviitaleaceae bacterium]
MKLRKTLVSFLLAAALTVGIAVSAQAATIVDLGQFNVDWGLRFGFVGQGAWVSDGFAEVYDEVLGTPRDEWNNSPLNMLLGWEGLGSRKLGVSAAQFKAARYLIVELNSADVGFDADGNPKEATVSVTSEFTQTGWIPGAYAFPLSEFNLSSDPLVYIIDLWNSGGDGNMQPNTWQEHIVGTDSQFVCIMIQSAAANMADDGGKHIDIKAAYLSDEPAVYVPPTPEPVAEPEPDESEEEVEIGIVAPPPPPVNPTTGEGYALYIAIGALVLSSLAAVLVARKVKQN